MAEGGRGILATERVLKALANRRRIQIIQLLSSKGRVSVGDVAAAMRLSIAATSRHLRTLAASELVKTAQSGTTIYYSLTRDRHRLLKATLESL